MSPATTSIEIDWDTANTVVLALDLLIGAYDRASASDLAKPYKQGTGSAKYWRARRAIDTISWAISRMEAPHD